MNKTQTSDVSALGNVWRKLPLYSSLKFQRTTLGIILVLPLVAILVGLLAFPVGSAIAVSMQTKSAGIPGEYIGLTNYIEIFTKDKAIFEVFGNTVIYTVSAVTLKVIIGLAMALLLNESIRGRNFFRGWLLLSWIAPTLAIGLTWRWMFDQRGVVNFIIAGLGLMDIPPAWLGSKVLAKVALTIANVWRGFPFFGVTLLSGLQSVSVELYEAAEMDGASIWQRIRYIAIPSLKPVLLVVIILSTIWTFNDFVLVWSMTGGGPAYSTHIFATYAYHLGFRGSRLGYASAVSLVATPLVILFILALAPRMWREEE